MTNKSIHISRHSAENILHGFDYAKCAGYEMNYQVVIVLRERLDASGATLFKQILRKYRRWFRRVQIKHGNKPIPPIHADTKENPNNNLHVNWALHIPKYLHKEFERKVVDWVNKVQVCEKTDIHIQKIKPNTEKNVANYMVKGIDPIYVDYLHLGRIASDQGEFYGRRSNISQAVSRMARKKVGFVPKRHRNDWKKNKKWSLHSEIAASQQV